MKFKACKIITHLFLFLSFVRSDCYIDSSLNNLSKEDIKLKDFIREHILEPPPDVPLSVDNMNLKIGKKNRTGI